MNPDDLMKLIGYDPRTIETPPRKGKEPQNIAPEIIELSHACVAVSG